MKIERRYLARTLISMENKDDWARLVRKHPVAFGVEAGFDKLEDIHNEWIKAFLFEEDDYTLQAHRGAYKTTCLSVAMALMIVIYPDTSIIFLRKTDADVRSIMRQVAKLLMEPIYQALAMDLYGEGITLETDSVLEIDTNLHTTATGAPQLSALSLGGSLTGQHADIVITDDIVTLKDRVSRANREQTKAIYQELENVKNDGGRFINTGTPWHEDDAFQLMQNINKADVYSSGLMTPETIEDRRSRMTPSLFAANYELKHIADSDSLFSAPQIDDGSRTELIFDGVAHVDAAYGGGDYSAFTIMKEADDGNLYVYGDLREGHINNSIKDFEDKRTVYRAGTMYNELNADKGYLAERMKRPVRTYHESMNKHIKISTYLLENWHRVVFIKDTNIDYINQILDYTENASHDDAPDSLASLIRETVAKSNKVRTMDRSLLGL